MGIGCGLAVIAARPTRVHVATLLWKAVVDVPCTLLRVALFVLRVVHKLLRVAPKNDTRCTKSATRRKNSNVFQFLYKALLLLRAVQKVQLVAVCTQYVDDGLPYGIVSTARLRRVIAIRSVAHARAYWPRSVTTATDA